jgi:hypothetical protein
MKEELEDPHLAERVERLSKKIKAPKPRSVDQKLN